MIAALDEIKGLDERDISPLVLAHVGDAYFHLFVRVKLISRERRVHELHERSAQIVSAINQARAYRLIESRLTDEERDIFRRGRNAKSHLSRHTPASEYHMSTGFEALLGTLFIRRQFARLDEIAGFAFDEIDRELAAEEDSQ